MRGERARLLALALAALASCSRPAPGPAGLAASRPPAVCRVGPDGGPGLADRGIGGTGAPVREADRGIGGTGGPAVAERGIGGTGIIGVITGFASVCLAGQEVALPPGVPVSIDGGPATPDALRAGQVAAVEAAPDATGLQARRVVVRDEVSGPVEAAQGSTLRVAGQTILLTPTTWGARPSINDWLAVSGLRREDGAIEATRLEPRTPGPVLVRGRLREDGGTFLIGDLKVRRVPGLAELAGQQVTIAGDLVAGTLVPDGITPDLLAVDPAAFFGPRVGIVLVEGFAVLEGGRLRLGQGFSAPAPGLRLEGAQKGVFRLERTDGGLRAVGLSERPSFAPAPSGFGRQFEPAPVPNRSIRGPNANRTRFGTRAGPNARRTGPGDDAGPSQRDGFGPGDGPRFNDGPGGAGGPASGPPPRGR